MTDEITTTFYSRTQEKCDTEANWEAANPVLLKNEVIYIKTADGDTRTKTGDGTSRYKSLSFNDKNFREKVSSKISNVRSTKNGEIYLIGKWKDSDGKYLSDSEQEQVTTNAYGVMIGQTSRIFFVNGNSSVNIANGTSQAWAVAIGSSNYALAPGSIAIGSGNIFEAKSGYGDILIGSRNKKLNDVGWSGYALGCDNTVKAGIAIGANCSVLSGGNSGDNMPIALGTRVTASGARALSTGYCNDALEGQTKIGKYSKDGTAGGKSSTDGDAFIIGNGTSDTARSNAFRVTYTGQVYGTAAYSSTGADYAEYFEWFDGNSDNEDRRGRLVTLDGEKIRLATAKDDYILGVVSANPCVKGDVYSDDWQGKYLTDVFGQRLTKTVHIPDRYEEREEVDPETGETKIEKILVEKEHDAVQWIINPDYDQNKEYISREDRPEWAPVGMMGKLVVVDDGTCEVNGFCKAGINGIATKADNGYRVMKRIDETHILVLVR